MRALRLASVVGAGAVVGIVVLVTARGPAGAQDKPPGDPGRVKWEYQSVDVGEVSEQQRGTYFTEKAKLDKLGADGWELVHVLPEGRINALVRQEQWVFKRRK